MANVLNKVPHRDSVFHNTEELEEKGKRGGGKGGMGGWGGGRVRGGEMVYSLPAAAACLGFAFPFSPLLALDLSSTAPNRKSLQHQRSFPCIKLPSNTGINNSVDHFYIALFSALEQTHCTCM